MKMYRIAVIVVSAFLLPRYAAALDSAASVSSTSTSTTFQSAPAPTPDALQLDAATAIKRADFAGVHATSDVHHIADWVADSRDNQGLPFVIVDKINAKIFVFDAGGVIRGAGPVLLGLARGDDTVPGIGDRELSNVRPEERTTPAGRFVAERGMNAHGVDIVWVDYNAAVSMHRVITSNPKERRLERLATPTSTDNRISYGCINMPAAFYDKVLSPSFAHSNGIVYILPETRPIRQVFGSYDVADRPKATAQSPQTTRLVNVIPSAR